MPNLWTLDHFKPTDHVVVEGDTLPALFWNAARRRADRVILRQKDFGVWRGWTWRETSAIVREIAMGLVADGLGIGEIGRAHV